jgi:8-oxo-dGTP diphosphatase
MLSRVALLVIRHASAGSPEEWRGDDRERPLDPRGVKQAKKLVRRLADLPIERILTSPYLRCVQTVEPLAAARGLVPEVRDELAVERQHSDGVEFVRGLAGENVAVCGHGGLETAIAGAPRLKKGRTLVVGDPLEVRKP